jgi:oxalate---CoA ligase
MYELLRTLALDQPKQTALVAPERRSLSFSQLLAQIESVRNQLHHWGYGRQDRIAIVLSNGPEMATAFLGVIATATAAPLNPAYRSQEFAFYLKDLKAKALILQSGASEEARHVALSLGLQVITLQPDRQAEAGIFTLESDLPELSISPLDQTPQPSDQALVLHTSGTTSRPKLVLLTQANLLVSAENIAAWLKLTAQDRCLNVMPLFHIHGLIGCLLASLVSGGSVCCAPGFQAVPFFDWLVEWQPTWYSAVPTIHQMILARAQLRPRKLEGFRLRFVRSSSASLPQSVMAELEALFQVPVIEAYGMTEATHQMASNPLPPRLRKSGSVGLAAGPAVAIMDNAGNLLAPYSVGEIVVQGANVTSGYESNPAANQTAFTNGWFRTGDEGFLDADGYLFIRGRLKEIINRGGEKISPREVDDVLLGHPAVLQAVTFAISDPQLGEEVGAAIVLRPQCTATAPELQAFAAEKLAPFKIPRQVVFCPEIPKGPTGKLQRIGLADKLGIKAISLSTQAAYEQFVAPRTLVEETLVRIWAEVLGLAKVGTQDNFFALGGDSLLAVHLFAEIEQTLGDKLPLSSLFQASTIEQQAHLILEKDAFNVLMPIQVVNSRRPPLFLIHPVHGHVLGYRDLAHCLGEERSVYGLQALGLDGRHRPLTQIAAIAAYCLKEIQTVQNQGPYFLGGFSFGGLVAVEIAQQLRQQGKEVALVALFDSYVPGSRKPMPKVAPWKMKWLHWQQKFYIHSRSFFLLEPQKGYIDYLQVLLGSLSKRVSATNRSIKAATQELFEGQIDGTAETIGLPDPIAPETGVFRDELAQVLSANRTASESYQLQPYSGEIILFQAELVDLGYSYAPALGWLPFAVGKLEIHKLPTYHVGIMTQPWVAEVAKRLKAAMEHVETGSMPQMENFNYFSKGKLDAKKLRT